MPPTGLLQRARVVLADRRAWYRRRRVLVPAGVLAAWALAGFLLVPAWIRHAIPGWVAEGLGAQASLEELRINPFLFTLEARGFRLAEAGGEPLASFDRLFVDFELSSVFRRAWTFAELRLESPEFDFTIEPDGRLNLLRVLEALPPSEAPAADDGAPPPVLLEGARIDGAVLRFADLRGSVPASAVLGPVGLHLAQMATLPGHRGTARVDIALPGDAELDWEGELSLHPLASDGRIALKRFRPESVWDFAREHLLLDPPRGEFEASLGYAFAMDGDAPRLIARDIALSAKGLALQRAGDARPMLELAGLGMTGATLDLAAGRFEAGELTLRDGRVAASLDAAGVLDWSTLVPAGAAAPVAADPAPVSPFSIALPAVRLAGIGVELRDASRNAPLGFATRIGELGLAARVELGAGEPVVAVSGLDARLEDTALTTGEAAEPMGRIGRIEVGGGSLALAARRFEAARVALDGVSTTLHRESDGSIREITLASTPDPAQPLPVTQAAATWQAGIGELVLSGLDLGYVDAITSPPIELGVEGGRITLRSVDTASAADIGVDALLPLAHGGRIALQGSAAGDGSAAELGLRVEGLSLLTLAPMVAQQTTLVLAGGTLDTELSLGLRAPADAPPSVQARGSLGVAGLRLDEADGGGRFLAWESLTASGVDFGLAPDGLQVRELRLLGPDAKLVVARDRTTNLSGVMREPPPTGDAEPSGAAPGAQAAQPAAEAASAAEPFPVRIDRVRIEGGTVDFTDYSLVLPFAARIEKFAGVANGISSAGDSRATLKFSGRVGEFGEAAIDGSLAPFDPTRYTDIEVDFRNIALSPLSPYSATFAGRTIEGGDIDLGLEYRVEEGRLAGDNKVLLQDFRLGGKVDSPGAVDLPLDLAIALLEDSQGRIDLAVPVSGDLGDPQFSYGKVVWKAVGNLLTGVVTAPFRALGSLFGGADAEAMQAVRFASGSTELMPRERERIAKVAEALASRPHLAVRVPPGIEPERDGYAVRRLAVRRAHAAELGFELDPGEDPGPVSYDDPKSQLALEALLESREGHEAADAFADRWGREKGAEPERVNAALAMIGRGAGDREYYRALYLHLVGSTPEPPEELEAIARGRSEAVVAEFLRLGIEPARAGPGDPVVLTQAPTAGVLLPLQLAPVR